MDQPNTSETTTNIDATVARLQSQVDSLTAELHALRDTVNTYISKDRMRRYNVDAGLNGPLYAPNGLRLPEATATRDKIMFDATDDDLDHLDEFLGGVPGYQAAVSRLERVTVISDFLGIAPSSAELLVTVREN